MDEGRINKSKIRIYVMGKKYSVPVGLTIMGAMEYIGYRFIRGCGCRGGFCGACSTVYRIEDDYKIYMDLACQKIVEDKMHLVQIPFTPAKKQIYNINDLKPSRKVIFENYPEIARCLSCNTCTKACPQDLEVMDIVQAAIKGDIKKVAELSFDCIQCGLCAIRCPMDIVPYHPAQLARRLYGKYVAPRSKHLHERDKEILEGKFDEKIKELTKMSVNELREEYVKSREMIESYEEKSKGGR